MDKYSVRGMSQFNCTSHATRLSAQHMPREEIEVRVRGEQDKVQSIDALSAMNARHIHRDGVLHMV